MGFSPITPEPVPSELISRDEISSGALSRQRRARLLVQRILERLQSPQPPAGEPEDAMARQLPSEPLLRDEAVLLAERLELQGGTVWQRPVAGMFHDFVLFAPAIEAAREQQEGIARLLRETAAAAA